MNGNHSEDAQITLVALQQTLHPRQLLLSDVIDQRFGSLFDIVGMIPKIGESDLKTASYERDPLEQGMAGKLVICDKTGDLCGPADEGFERLGRWWKRQLNIWQRRHGFESRMLSQLGS